MSVFRNNGSGVFFQSAWLDTKITMSRSQKVSLIPVQTEKCWQYEQRGFFFGLEVQMFVHAQVWLNLHLFVCRETFPFWNRSSLKSTCRQSISSFTPHCCPVTAGQTRPQRSSEPESSTPPWTLSNTLRTAPASQEPWRSLLTPCISITPLKCLSWPLTFSVWHGDCNIM